MVSASIRRSIFEVAIVKKGETMDDLHKKNELKVYTNTYLTDKTGTRDDVIERDNIKTFW